MCLLLTARPLALAQGRPECLRYVEKCIGTNANSDNTASQSTIMSPCHSCTEVFGRRCVEA